MVISRADGILNMCEMKYAKDDYLVTADEEEKIRKRLSCLSQKAKVKKAVHPVLLTTFGVVDNAYRYVFQNVVTANDLFVPADD